MTTETVVKDKRLLNSLAKAGHITLHAQTGQKVYWCGRAHKAWYIEDYKSVDFEHKGQKFIARYVDGCFNPYVFKIDKATS